MTTFAKGLGLSTLVLGGAMGATVFAQMPASDQSAPPAASQSTSSTDARPAGDVNDSTTYATGKPLGPQSKEGFWGHMNPFARKKWVQREVDPIKDRTNELDQLQAKNANDIKDVDGRATAGISKAMMAANTADQHASDAANKANQAQTTATGASTRTDQLNGTVSNLDQYSQVTATDVKFAHGRTALGPEGKSSLDDMASKLAGEKGYIIEVQGFSRAGVPASQAMADSVVRYLVTEHQVPLYRIYRTGLGKSAPAAAAAPASGSTTETASASTEETPIVNGVRVTLLHNSLATMGSASASNSYPSSAPSQTQQQPMSGANNQ
jgi:outer membrane protein OmpA-like peptidoglycan-associated protein